MNRIGKLTKYNLNAPSALDTCVFMCSCIILEQFDLYIQYVRTKMTSSESLVHRCVISEIIIVPTICLINAKLLKFVISVTTKISEF